MAAELIPTEIESEALSWPQKAKAITIMDQESYDKGAALLVSIATLERQIIDHHKEPKEKAFQTHRSICAAEKRLLDPLTEAKGIIKRGLGVWVQEQEQIRLEAQRKADELARKIEEEARLALAVEAEKAGATEETKAEILATPIPIVRPIIQPTFQKATGVSSKKKWAWRIVDANQIPRQYLQVDEVKINGVVRAMGAAANIPGIQVFEDTQISVRTR
jgi:hypothetical protein